MEDWVAVGSYDSEHRDACYKQGLRTCYIRPTTSDQILPMHNEAFKATFLLSYFIVLFLLTYDMPSAFHHFLRDVALRYFATFSIVSFFVCHENSFQHQTRFNSLINLIGQNSLAIYLIDYFFLPQFRPIPEWLAGLNMVTVHIMSLLYTVAITALCLVFIKFLSNSKFISKYVLGKNRK